jgi:hypothetical protein
MAKAKRVDIVPDGKGWAARQDGKKVAKSATKSVVVRLVTKAAKKGTDPLTVRIYKRDGTVQKEKTYPSPAPAKPSKR